MSWEEITQRCHEVHQNRYTYPWSGINRDSLHEKVPIICPDHGEFMQGLAIHMYGGSGCPSCAPGGGFNSQESGVLYSMKIHLGKEVWWWKVGVSHNPEKRRRDIQKSVRASGMHLSVSLTSLVDFEVGSDALELERLLLKQTESRAKSVEKFDGAHELFLRDPLNLAIELGLLSPSQIRRFDS